MSKGSAVAVVGTFDTKGAEHCFLKERIEARGLAALTIHVGTAGPSPFQADHDLYAELLAESPEKMDSRDLAIDAMLTRAAALVRELFSEGRICGVISAGGGTGTYLGSRIMRGLPLGVPKVMVSTVASRDMSDTVGTRDITMIHSVTDLLGVNSITGRILDRAAGAVCGMVNSTWSPPAVQRRIALTMFGFITEAAENIKALLEVKGCEVVAFHANGTGGMAMEELAAEGYFDGILDLATHELADQLKGGYCRGIGPQRLEPVPGRVVPRLVVPGGLDCAVLEFTRSSIPEQYRNRKIFFYDFRSAVRLDRGETEQLARQLSEKLSRSPESAAVLVPMAGWSEADRPGGPLYDPEMREAFLSALTRGLDSRIPVQTVDVHINDAAFATLAAEAMLGLLGTERGEETSAEQRGRRTEYRMEF